MVENKFLKFKNYLEKENQAQKQQNPAINKAKVEQQLRLLEMKLEKDFKERPSEYIREMAKAILEFAESRQVLS